MDDLREYINMCSKATEIQLLNDGFSNENFAHQFVCIEHGNILQEDQEGCPYCSSCKMWNSNVIWLPRQDQLQKMVIDDVGGLIDAFNLWEEGCGYIRMRDKFKSFEQLWLAFVMIKKFNKTWNGQDWGFQTT